MTTPLRPNTSTASETVGSRPRSAVFLLNMLCGVVFRLTHRRVDAGYLVQETTMKVYVVFGPYCHRAIVRLWPLRLMHHRSVSRYTAAKRRPQEQPTDRINNGQLARHGRHSSELLSAEIDALEAMRNREIADTIGATADNSPNRPLFRPPQH
jgi:RNA polymerase sigma-70 factor, ECF subfamily